MPMPNDDDPLADLEEIRRQQAGAAASSTAVDADDPLTDLEAIRTGGITVAASPTSDTDIADAARRRLQRSGLTPDAVKGGRGLITPSDISTRTSTPDRGFWGELRGAITPSAVLANFGSSMGRIGGDMFGALFNSDDESRQLQATDADMLSLTPVPNVPAMIDISREATRRGNVGESTAGLWGSVTPGIVMGLAGLSGGRAIRGAPKRAATAEAAYAEATGADAAMSRQMMDRGIVVRDPAAQSGKAATAATKATTDRSAIPAPKPVRGEGGQFQVDTSPEATALAMRRATLADEAKFQTNLSKILKAIPETDTPAGAVGKTVSHVGVQGGLGGLGLTSLGVPKGVATAAAAIYVLRQTAVSLTKTNAWRTAAPIYQRRFANALLMGDADTAATVGALIASGQATAVSNDDSNRK